MFPRVFLLSPANTRGLRAQMIMRPGAEFDLAVKLRNGSATIGEVYAFISGLYFRGKTAYVAAFGAPPEGVPPAVIIVPGIGLVPMNASITVDQLVAISQIDIHEANEAYLKPLLRDAKLIDDAAGAECSYVLLGSIASEKYTRPLLEVFGDRLLFPEAFVGRGDMSRGGLMLRCADSKHELKYVPVRNAVRHGARPPKLEKRRGPKAVTRAIGQQEAIIFIGIQGAGKTTYFYQHYRTHVHASRDVQGTAEASLIAECLAAKKSFVIDDTHPTRQARAQHIRAAKAAGFRVIAIFFDTPARAAIGRNNHRADKKPIPVPAILRAAKQLEKPELEEGFDEIRIVQTSAGDT